jgi:hypothetical protein
LLLVMVGRWDPGLAGERAGRSAWAGRSHAEGDAMETAAPAEAHRFCDLRSQARNL